MKATFRTDGYEYELTTEHATSSLGQPVLLSDGQLTDVQIDYQPDTPEAPTPLDLLADVAGIWNGPETRRQLAILAQEMLSAIVQPNGADYDTVISEFIRRKDATE